MEEIEIKKYDERDILQMKEIWNEVVNEGNAFPQNLPLNDINSARDFFSLQSYCGVAKDNNNEVLGLYILHPNNVGHCAHICNASFAVSSKSRGLHIGEKLVKDCIERARTLGFKIMQFNAVVATNIHALHLYERLGFIQLGKIPKGFCFEDGKYEDIFVYYKTLV